MPPDERWPRVKAEREFPPWPDLVVGDEEDRVGRSLRGAANDAREVASHQRARFGVAGGNALERLVVIDASEPEQRGQHVRVACGDTLASPALKQRAGEDERDMGGLLVGVMPLLVHPAVGAEHLPVIGGENHNCVLVGVGARRAASTRPIWSSTVRCSW